MLTAHANTTVKDFTAQLRTYVIALGCSAQVVDCVDKLGDADEIEERRDVELQEAKENAGKEMKEEILAAVRGWGAASLGEVTMNELIDIIEEVV